MRVVMWQRRDAVRSRNMFLTNNMSAFSTLLLLVLTVILACTVEANVPVRIRCYVLAGFAEEDFEITFWYTVVHVPSDNAHLYGRSLSRLLGVRTIALRCCCRICNLVHSEVTWV